MTATMPRSVAIAEAEPNLVALPAGQHAQQSIAVSATAATTGPQEHDQKARDTQCASGMLLWDPLLHTLAAGLDDIEAVRISQQSRYRVLTATGPDSDGQVRGFGLDGRHPAVSALQMQLDTLAELEAGMTKALRKQLRQHPLHPWITAQVGLGDKQVARLLAAIRDPYWNDLYDRPRTVSELWAFSGLHVLPGSHRTNETHWKGAAGSIPAGGVAPAHRRGHASNWSDEARKRVYLIAASCIKFRQSPYRAVYDAGREMYADAVHPVECRQCGPSGKPAAPGSPLNLGHQHARALRLVMKHVLKDLWIESKRLYGSP